MWSFIKEKIMIESCTITLALGGKQFVTYYRLIWARSIANPLI